MKRQKAPKAPPDINLAAYCVVCRRQLHPDAHPLVHVCSVACHQAFVDGITMLAEEAGMSVDEYMRSWKAEWEKGNLQ